MKPGLDDLSKFSDAEKTISLYISYCKHVLKETPGSTETSFSLQAMGEAGENVHSSTGVK